jgi:hypothetical protein
METDQLLRFGTFDVKIETPRDTLLVGDSIRIRVQLPETFLDSISLTQTEVESIRMGFYMTRDTEEQKDTSLIYIFDQYFDISLNKGEQIDPYRYLLENTGSGWILDFHYVCKRSLKYFIPIHFEEIVAKGVNTDCMFGNTETWDAQIFIDNDFNTFENKEAFPNYFGFVVKG